MKKSIFLLLALIVLMPSVALAQRTITGKVVDADNNSPLIGASLYWKNTTAGTTTTTDGSFSIRRVNGFETLVVDYLGYDIAEIEVGKEENTLDIRLKPSAVDIDEVVVEGQQRGNYAKSGGITRQEQISFQN